MHAWVTRARHLVTALWHQHAEAQTHGPPGVLGGHISCWTTPCVHLSRVWNPPKLALCLQTNPAPNLLWWGAPNPAWKWAHNHLEGGKLLINTSSSQTDGYEIHKSNTSCTGAFGRACEVTLFCTWYHYCSSPHKASGALSDNSAHVTYPSHTML